LQGQVQEHIAVDGPVRLQASKARGVWYGATAPANGGQIDAATTSCPLGHLTCTANALVQQHTVRYIGLHACSRKVTCKYKCGMYILVQ